MERAWELFLKGGVVMYPLVLLSIFTLTILFERIMTYNKRMVDGDKLFSEAKSLLKNNEEKKLEQLCQKSGSLGEVFWAGYDVREKGEKEVKEEMEEKALHEINSLYNNISYLDTIVTMAPLLGLLGTVVGMIGAFSVLDVAGSGKPLAITGGVAEALVATATGLGVALVALCAHTYLNNRVDRFITMVEKLTGQWGKLLR